MLPSDTHGNKLPFHWLTAHGSHSLLPRLHPKAQDAWVQFVQIGFQPEQISHHTCPPQIENIPAVQLVSAAEP